jgi:predicted nucleic acid-binding protein
MSRIFWDTNLFIYLLEGTGHQMERVRDIQARMRDRGDTLYTSTLTLGEILVKPNSLGETQRATAYASILLEETVLIPFDYTAALNYGIIRGDRTIQAPDAIQLACAGAVKTDLFITNDGRLARKKAPGVQFVTSIADAFL